MKRSEYRGTLPSGFHVFVEHDMNFRFLHRRSKTAPGTERHAVAFGIKAGYWPCHKGPFITIEFATHRIDMWYGTPSTEA